MRLEKIQCECHLTFMYSRGIGMNRYKLGQGTSEWLHMWGAGITVAITGALPLACGTEGRQAMKNLGYGGGPQGCGVPIRHTLLRKVLKRIERNGKQAGGAIVVTQTLYGQLIINVGMKGRRRQECRSSLD